MTRARSFYGTRVTPRCIAPSSISPVSCSTASLALADSLGEVAVAINQKTGGTGCNNPMNLKVRVMDKQIWEPCTDDNWRAPKGTSGGSKDVSNPSSGPAAPNANVATGIVPSANAVAPGPSTATSPASAAPAANANTPGSGSGQTASSPGGTCTTEGQAQCIGNVPHICNHINPNSQTQLGKWLRIRS